MAAVASRWKRFLKALKSQWLATALLIPVSLLAVQTYIARQDARQARAQAVNVDRISKVQESGKALDAALAGYFQSVAELGLAERKLRMPGTYKDIPVPKAEATVVEARSEARQALAKHAGDIQGLRGTFDESASAQYMSALAEVSSTVDGEADIRNMPASVTAFGKLVGERNAMVDQAMRRVS